MGVKDFLSNLLGKAKETATIAMDKAEDLAEKASAEIK